MTLSSTEPSTCEQGIDDSNHKLVTLNDLRVPFT